MQTIHANRWVALGTLGVMTLGATMSATTPVQADSSGWKKGAIAGAVITGAGLLKHNGKMQTLGAAATIGSYLMYRKAKKKEERRAAARRSAYLRRHRHRRHVAHG